ncbi:glycine zipper domain-containing protein [Magnetospira sp. QH-2]|uniref:glycine zipper domain-containing protein n=1 Tax=Magnetospira sp. (strain QH-2) TaxID=1288970 RepID=UPI0003E814AF|nr:glycine zipper domain-containing protein [Magnetospira sp. QH-2]CCQ73206.1 Protein of unknown function. Similar to Lipoprotein from Magnetospirillum gryphiswaldense [Magnetospira sp. QH-2]
MPGLGETSTSRQALRDSNATFSRTVGEGVAAGALLGGLLGYVVTGKVRGGLVGGMLGAVAGGVAGNYVAQKQASAASREEAQAAILADLKAKNVEAQRVLNAARVVVDEDLRKMAGLRKDLADGHITQKEFNQQMQRVQRDKKLLDEAVQNTDEQIAFFEDTVKSMEERGLESGDSEASREVAEMRSKRKALLDLGEAYTFADGAP